MKAAMINHFCMVQIFFTRCVVMTYTTIESPISIPVHLLFTSYLFPSDTGGTEMNIFQNIPNCM